MGKIRFTGPLRHKITGAFALNRIAIATYLRHARGRKLAPDWSAEMEIGIRFWRHQFTRAMACKDPAEMRQIFDAVQTETDDRYEVEIETTQTGTWVRPLTRKSPATLLYFHGGGYAFRAAVSHRFAAMLAHRMGADVYMPEYRLTPEHPHPAQAEDALAAWDKLCETCAPSKIVVIGDSAGGHMALMLLQSLKARGTAQPALCVGLCPWTDIGARGASLTENDLFDLVQGWMALTFGDWLDPNGLYGRVALSPIYQDYQGLAPIYLQTGGREVLHDMIVEFHAAQMARGAEISLDIWPDMPHDFQVYDSYTESSKQALIKLEHRIAEAVSGAVTAPDQP